MKTKSEKKHSILESLFSGRKKKCPRFIIIIIVISVQAEIEREMASPRPRAPLALALLLVIAAPLCDAQCATMVGQDVWELSTFATSSCPPSTPVMKGLRLASFGCSGGQLAMTNLCYNYPHATTSTGGGAGAGSDPWDADWLTVAPLITAATPGGSAVGPTSFPECPAGQALSSFVTTGSDPNGQFKWGCIAITGSGGTHTPNCYDYETSCTTTVTAEMWSIVYPECQKNGVDGALQKFAVKVGGVGTSCPANNAYMTYSCCFTSPLVGVGSMQAMKSIRSTHEL